MEMESGYSRKGGGAFNKSIQNLLSHIVVKISRKIIFVKLGDENIKTEF
jgi:hypothetical protein